jgi:uncharacterized protein involved in exopolysaccharide biosynthesis
MNDTQTTPPMPVPDEDEISLLDLATALGEEKATLFAIPFITTVVAVVVSLLMTPIFTAKTVVMPPQQQQSGAAAALASLGGLAGLAGAAGGIKSPDEMYVALLGSENLQNRLIADLKLQERYETKTLTDTRAALKSQVRFSADKKSGLLSIEAEDKDPVFAAELANRHVAELRTMLGRLAVTEAQQRRVFYEQQIQQTQDKLAVAEVAFRAAKEKSGMQVTSVLAETGVRASAELRGQIAAREVQLQAMSRFATAQNPDTQRIASELSALRVPIEQSRARLRREQGGGQPIAPRGCEVLSRCEGARGHARGADPPIRIGPGRRGQRGPADPASRCGRASQSASPSPSAPRWCWWRLLPACSWVCWWPLCAAPCAKAQSDPASAGQWLALKKAWSLRG